MDAVELLNRIRGYVCAKALLDFMRSAEFVEASRKLDREERGTLHEAGLDRWGDLVVPWPEGDNASGGAL